MTGVYHIVGKGPLKEYYKKKIDKLKLSRVMFCLPWLEAEDYPKLLGINEDYFGISITGF